MTADGASAPGPPAATAATADLERRRVLVAGDAQGDLSKLFSQVKNQQARAGCFDMLLCVGAFLPGPEAGSAATSLVEYVSGKQKAPLETYFIESRSAALLQASPGGKRLCENVNFLGGYGIRQLHGLQVAYLSGRYDPAVYAAPGSAEAGQAFIGAAYTPQAIKGLIDLARQPGMQPIDVLLTGEWPAQLAEKLEAADMPRDPDDPLLRLPSAPPVAELCTALEPRYHLFGTADVFYKRPPFQTQRQGFVCRSIGLGRVGSKGKSRLWVHGLALSPASQMPESLLMQRPDNTTPCPFAATSSLKRLAANMTGTAEKTEKKEEDDETPQSLEDDGGQVIPDRVFLSRLPPNIEEKRLEKALKHVGTIEHIRLARDEGEEGRPCKGFGWITFSSPEEAQVACDLSGMLECGGRTILICLAKPEPAGKGGEGPRKKREVKIVVEPHRDCWFCLANPKVEKHMIITATTEVYLAMARGPILPTHVLILPVKHAPCYAACPPELRAAIQRQLVAVRKMCSAAGQECLVWERWIPMGVSAANHMQIQVLPIDNSRAGYAREALQETAKRILAGASFQKVASHEDVAGQVNDDSATPYVYFEIPGDNTAKGRSIERYVFAGTEGRPRIPLTLGRQVACHLLGCEEKVDWRHCQEDRESERKLADTFREQFKGFK